MKSDIPLVRSVLHPTDFSPASDRAFAHALAVALLRQTELTILNVGREGGADTGWVSFPQVRSTLEKWNLLSPGRSRSAVLDELNVEVRKISIRGRHPANATVDFLEQQPHDLVVLATDGLSTDGGDALLHRSDAEAIARGSGALTLFVPSGAERVLVSLEDGDLSLNNVIVAIDAAIDFSGAIEFARRAAEIIGDGDVTITLLHVGEQMPRLPALPEGSDWTWDQALRQGDPVESILSTSQELDANLIVMTTNGRDTLGQALKGSTTERVLRSADCPVLAVPAGRYQA